MATVDSWFRKFQLSVMSRLDRADWPDAESEFWDEFKRSLVRHGATERDSREALSLVAEEPPKYAGELIPTFKRALQAVWKQAEAQDDRPICGTFAEASVAARGCRDCHGSGFASVYHQTIAYRPFSAICECAAGRWQFDRLGRDNPEFAADNRLIRLLDVKTGDTPYGLEPKPLEWLSDATGTPLVEVWARNNPPRPVRCAATKERWPDCSAMAPTQQDAEPSAEAEAEAEAEPTIAQDPETTAVG